MFYFLWRGSNPFLYRSPPPFLSRFLFSPPPYLIRADGADMPSSFVLFPHVLAVLSLFRSETWAFPDVSWNRVVVMSSWALLPALSLHPKIWKTHTQTHTQAHKHTHTHTHTHTQSQRGRYKEGNICPGCREGEETKRERLINGFEKQFKVVKTRSLPHNIYKYSTSAI